MIRTLWLLGVLALTLAAVVLVLCAARLGQANGHEELGIMSSAVERFRQVSGDSTLGDRRSSPLVQQAQAFASYLNPPPAAGRPIAGVAASKPDTPAATAQGPWATAVVPEAKPAAASSPKFALHGISYYRSKPEQSMALVCEPGGQRRWIRQGAQFGHLTVERIDSDSIVCRDGAQMLVMQLMSREAVAKAVPPGNSSPSPKPANEPARTAPAPPPVRGLRQMPLARVAAKIGAPSSQIPLPDDGLMESQ